MGGLNFAEEWIAVGKGDVLGGESEEGMEGELWLEYKGLKN